MLSINQLSSSGSMAALGKKTIGNVAAATDIRRSFLYDDY